MTIAEVSQKYGISTDTLRYYERVGMIPAVKRGNNGQRDYGQEDCAWVELALCMRSAGLPISAISEYVELALAGDDTFARRRALLIRERKALEEQKHRIELAMDRLDYKISRYNDAVEQGFLSW